jgi:hypothetical protein
MGYELTSMHAIPDTLDQGQLTTLRRRDIEDHDIALVPISSLAISPDSPRLAGEDKQHTLRLAEVDSPLPPILVHRQRMTVIDGMHRLKAAMLKGHDTISAKFFDGSKEEAFLQAVRANTTHGLPLTTKERRTAAGRIVAAYPHLSNRSIAAYAGISDKTVGVIRRSAPEDLDSSARLGADGRVRPLDTQRARQRAADIINERPAASLREVAEEAGISIGTAHHVRQRMHRGEDPVRARAACPQPAAAASRCESSPPEPPLRPARVRPDRPDAIDRRKILGSLIKDPALRHAERGRELLRWLQVHVIAVEHCLVLIDAVPAHRIKTVARIARECEQVWREFAQELERRDPDVK